MQYRKYAEFYTDTQTYLKCRREVAVKPETKLTGFCVENNKLFLCTPLIITNNDEVSKI